MKIRFIEEISRDLDVPKVEACRYCPETSAFELRTRNGIYHIFCRACGAHGPFAGSVVDAITMWNNGRNKMTEQQKIERVQELLLEPFQGCDLKEPEIKKQLMSRFKAILSSLIEFDTEKKGGDVEINVKLPPDLWGAVLEKIEKEGY